MFESAKRTKNERSGIHDWHPYYAGYSERFVESALRYLDLDNESVILDPWNGSGTTSIVANRKNLSAIGFDVNPVMNVFSMAKVGSVLNYKDEICKYSCKVNNHILNGEMVITNDDPLLSFMSKNLCNIVRNAYKFISVNKMPTDDIRANIRQAFEGPVEGYCVVSNFLLAALFITARKLAGYKGGSNPTWIKSLEEKPIVSKKKFVNAYQEQIKKMLLDLEKSGINTSKSLIHISYDGDSRCLPIKSNSINGVITSPPYLTRIDYAMSTKPELLLLSNLDNLRFIREKTMGAPVIADKTIEPKSTWGKLCNNLLLDVANHTSKAAISYYLPNMLQYFRDANESLREIVRVLKPKSKALIVVQSSYFKEYEISLGDIYVEMCKYMPVKANIAFRNIVRGHIAHVNTRSNYYKKDKIFHEDVVEITKR